MKKLAYDTQLSYEITDIEKETAEKALLYFDHLLKKIEVGESHLDMIYDSFKDNKNANIDEIWKNRALLRRYRDQVLSNFNEIKKISFKCFVLMQKFSSDTQVIKLNNSFTLSIADLEKQVNILIGIFDDLQSNDFSTYLIKCIDSIKKESAQLKQIIEDRIKSFILTNILARNWIDNVSEELQTKIETKVPLTVQLIQNREKEINKEQKKM